VNEIVKLIIFMLVILAGFIAVNYYRIYSDSIAEPTVEGTYSLAEEHEDLIG